MSVEKISKIFEKNFARTLRSLLVSFAFVTSILFCTFLYFGISEARNQADGSIKAYRNNLVSIFILNEQSALDVAISALNEGSSLVHFARDNGQTLGLLAFRAVIETAGKEHGTLIYTIKPMQGLNSWIFGVSIFSWILTLLAVVVAFRRAQIELIESVSVPLELLSEKIRTSATASDKAGFQSHFDTLENPGTQEISDLQDALKRFSNEISEAHETAVSAKQDKAVASMTQMLAHDVRKPFSMFQASLEMIQQCRNASELKMVTQDFIPEINRAMNSVNGLLQDVMEVSSKAVPHLEEVRPEALIETTLVDLFSMQQDSSIALAYDFKNRRAVNADVQKLMRVFLNICGNAAQAMKGKGYIKFATRDLIEGGKDFVEFSILNTGSFIPEQDLSQLFEAFFTKNKKGGTGLGLAIAKKVVQAHGGRIFCRSKKDEAYPQGFVEFIFTIPAGGAVGQPQTAALPNHSSELRSKVMKLNSRVDEDAEQSIGVLELEQKVVQGLKKLGRKLDLLMVDDEQVYKNAIRLHCARSSELSELISISFASGSSEIDVSNLDGAILDVDLERGSLDGFEIASHLRNKFGNAFTCMHSNRTFADDFKRSLNSGADAFLPKPMSYEHFLRFLAQVESRLAAVAVSIPLDRGNQDHPKEEPTGRALKHEKIDTPRQERTIVAVVDDSRLVRTSWTLKLTGIKVVTFESPEAFFVWSDDSRELLPNLKAIVTDFHFDDKSSLTGHDFALSLRQVSDAPIVLCSDGEFEPGILNAFDTRIPKKALELKELEALLSNRT